MEQIYICRTINGWMDGWIEQRIHRMMMDGWNDIEQLIDRMMDDRQIKYINEQWMDGTKCMDR